jgi:asparagine synthase (glutamine-hydrolysing)
MRDRNLLRAYVRNDLRAVMNDVLAHGELVGSGIIRAGVLACERARRKDGARQIWQLLTMELRYRNVRSVGVAA